MSKMHYFSNKISKIAKCWGSPPLTLLNLRFWWLEVAWFGQTVCFSNWLWRNELLKNQLWHHHNYVTEKCHQTITTQDFSILGPSQSKFLATPVTYLLSQPSLQS